MVIRAHRVGWNAVRHLVRIVRERKEANNTQAKYGDVTRPPPSSSTEDPGTYTGVTVEGYCLGPADEGESLGSEGPEGSYCFDSPVPVLSRS